MERNLIVRTVCATITVLGSVGLVSWWFSRRCSSGKQSTEGKRIPKKKSLVELEASTAWEEVGRVRNVCIYPMKSGAAINTNEAKTEITGFSKGACRDRCLITVNNKGQMETARKFPAMVKIAPQYDDSTQSITLRFPGTDSVTINLPHIEAEGKLKNTRIWSSEVSGYDCGDEVAAWLSLALGHDFRLLYHGSSETNRITKNIPFEKYPLLTEADKPLFADTGSFMLMTEASVADLGERVGRRIPYQNFRPNLLVEGTQTPYDEDSWTYIKIGEGVFRNTQPCLRCSFPNVDHDTGTRYKDMEPTKTLRQYRMIDDDESPTFGIMLGLEKAGTINVGDKVSVLRE